jgi:phage-related protein
MQKVIYTNKLGQEITIAYSFPYFLTEIKGLSGKDVQLNTTQNYGVDGVNFESVNLGIRPINMKFDVRTGNMKDMYAKKEEINRIFASKNSPGVFRYINNHIDVKTSVLIRRIEDIPTRRNGQVGFSVEMVATNPLLLKTIEDIAILEDYQGGFELVESVGFSFPIEFAMTDSEVKIINNGQIETPVLIEALGPATSPITITKKETSEFITIKTSLLSNEKLLIDTQKYTVKKVDPSGVIASAFNLIDINSNFFVLDVGLNTLKITSNGGKPKMIIHYNERYEGV